MSDNKSKSRKHHTVKPYITTPLSYVLISLLLIIPISLAMLNVSVNIVHRAQKYFPPKIADYTVSDSGFTPGKMESGNVEIPNLPGFAKIAELSCDNAGLFTSVYYGNNRTAYREGAGLSTNSGLCGTGGIIEISANASGGFKALYNVKKGDVITVVTTWGKYKYKVFDAGVRNDYPKAKGETLYLKTAADKNAFAAFGEQKLIVSASLISGPKAAKEAE